MDRLTMRNSDGIAFIITKSKFHKTGQRPGEYSSDGYMLPILDRLAEYEDALEPKALEEWNEDMGDCLWWRFPIEEPPYCGTPLDINFPSCTTHFTRLIMPLNTK